MPPIQGPHAVAAGSTLPVLEAPKNWRSLAPRPIWKQDRRELVSCDSQSKF